MKGMNSVSVEAHHAKCQLDEAQAGIKIARRKINNLRYAEDTTPPLWQRVKKNQRAS